MIKNIALFVLGAMMCCTYIALFRAPVRAVTLGDISYLELAGPEIRYDIDLHNSATGTHFGTVSDVLFFDPRLNFEIYHVPCEKEIGDLCAAPPAVFWARYIHKKHPLELKSTQYFTEDGAHELPPEHPFFLKLKKEVFNHFCRKTELCAERKKDGLGHKIFNFDFN